MLEDASLPIVLFEDRTELHVFPSIELACRYVEAIDVEDGIYEAFDGGGRAIQLLTHGPVVFADWPTESAEDPGEFERRVRTAIERIGAHRVGIIGLDQAALQAMLDALLSYNQGQIRKPRKPILGLIPRQRRRDSM
jgi:hypothetical protein